MARQIAALYVQERGCYIGLEGVDPWPVERDARLYAGPHPVVAHPPCSRWCQLAALVEARWGHKRGDDGGCFASALASVRTYGGVLEHPAFSKAWPAFNLSAPPASGGWVRGFCGGWVCQVDQSQYGHKARKSTWLYAFGTDLPPLLWGRKNGTHWVGHMARRGDGTACIGPGMRLGARAAASTPPEFRDLLISIARSAKPRSFSGMGG